MHNLRYLFLVLPDTGIPISTDNNTIDDSAKVVAELRISLKSSSQKLLKWSMENPMKNSTGKRHLIISTNDIAQMQVDESVIKDGHIWKNLLGIKIDIKLKFENHERGLC